ncbi:unnamed protein product [Euphydryas editha]|uniref:FLYWCH-type domain-containing protein n=1 Tax=Euphydryas editha TaxID=104508 RepID=A0AAU9TG61_EUPED|nr:unnamed protein product [Euphydryas editha]
MVNRFTFAKSNQRRWYCSKKTKGCKARIILNDDGTILDARRNVHNHDPPVYTQLSNGLYVRLTSPLAYEIVKSQRGKDLLLVEGYTYARNGHYRWVCSTHHPYCKAKLKLNMEGHVDLKYYYNNHIHEPKKIFHSNVVPYEFVQSQRGKPLLLINGYTFSQSSATQWICSLRLSDCKARLKYHNGVVTELYNEHTHYPRRYITTMDGQKVRL